MKITGIILADGFEEVEALTVVDLCRRAGIEVYMASINGTTTVTGSHGIRIMADCTFESLDLNTLDMLVLPGGMPGTSHLRAHRGVCDALKTMVANGKQIAAICAAPSILGELGLLSGQEACCYPGFEDKLHGASISQSPVCTGPNTTTSRGLGTAIPFALKLIERLTDAQTARKIAASIQYSSTNS